MLQHTKTPSRGTARRRGVAFSEEKWKKFSPRNSELVKLTLRSDSLTIYFILGKLVGAARFEPNAPAPQ